MRLLVEIGWGHKAGGMRRVSLNTLRQMPALCPDCDIIVVSNSFHPEIDIPGIRQIVTPAPRWIPQVIWDQFIFPHWVVPRLAQKLKPDVTHFTDNIISLWGCHPAVVTIHDMTPFVVPETFTRLHRMYMRWYFRLAARLADTIVTDSEHSRADICRLLAVPYDKVVSIPLAADLPTPSSTSPPTRPPSGPFLLYVGSINPRKNLARLIEAFDILKQEYALPHKLVVVGQAAWSSRSLPDLASYRRQQPDIVFTGRVDDASLVGFYQACDVFVYPSLYEGFGLPVLEAMALGAPVVTSDASSLPEVAGDAAILVDPHDPRAIAGGVHEVLNQPDLASRLRVAGARRAHSFSWSTTAEKLFAVLEAVASKPVASSP